MVTWLLRATFATVVLGFLAYAVVALPIGRRTLFEHAIAISETPPARQLASDVKVAASEAVQRVRARLSK